MSKNSGNTVHCRTLAVYPHDRLADGGLRLSAATQSHQRGSYHIIISPEKIKIPSTVSRTCVSLLHHHKVRKS